MKICIITNTFSSDLIGGSNIYTTLISGELVKKNNEVLVVAVSPDKKDSIKNEGKMRIYNFSPFNISTSYDIGKEAILKQGIWTLLDIYNFYSFRKIVNIIQKEMPDVVHIHTPLDITLSVLDAVKKLKLPLVFSVHDYLLLCRRVVLLHGSGNICTEKNINFFCKIYRAISNKIVNDKTDIVIFPSKFILEMFEKNRFFLNSKKIILPYAIKLSNFDNLVPDYINNRDSKGLNILYVGSLTRHKGVQDIINVFKQIKSDKITLSIVGNGVYKNTLEDLAKNDNRITFFGKINNENIAQFYKNADILVVPSLWHEVLGMVILEAFRAGIPVIGSKMGGIIELIKENYNGFLFEPGNVSQLKQIIENIIESPDSLKALRRNAQEYVKQYDLSAHINKLILIYEEAIKINKERH